MTAELFSRAWNIWYLLPIRR